MSPIIRKRLSKQREQPRTTVHVSKEDIQKMGKMFDHLDASKDGQISLEEIQRCMEEHQGDLARILDCDPDWKTMLAALDTNNDGMLDYHEFLQAATNRVELLTQQNLKKAFSIIDINGDGKLTAVELRATFAAGVYRAGSEELGDEFWLKMIEEADSNGDGVIDFKEFEAAMRSMLLDEKTIRAS